MIASLANMVNSGYPGGCATYSSNKSKSLLIRVLEYALMKKLEVNADVSLWGQLNKHVDNFYNF